MSRNGTITRKEFLWRGVGIAALAGFGVGNVIGCSSGESQGNVEIQYWHINTESFGGPTVRNLVARFQELNPNITVTERFQNGSYTGLLENLQTSLASDQLPDVAQIGYLYLNYVTENFPYVSIEDLVRDHGDDSLYDGMPENVLKLGQVDGKQIGMPYSVSNPVMYYNADMFSQAGLDTDNPPQDWEGWHEAAKHINDKLAKQGIWIYTLDDNWGTQAMIESNGGQMLGCNGGQATAVFDGPEATEAIQFWADSIQEGAFLNTLYDQGTQAFLSQGVAAIVDTIADRGNFQDQASFDLRATSFPSFGNRGRRLPAGGNNLFVFSQDAAKREAALRFIEFLTSRENLTTWTKGLGYIPTREGMTNDPQYLGDFIRNNPIERVAIDQTPLVVPWASFPGPDGLKAASQTLFSATQEVLGGKRSAKDGLSRAADEVNQSLSGQRCV
ncbi:MAG: ABC transporter substrate-binding protein [Rubrobacter sp.]|nr:ABC transporter substrate-binding protein [Rubrobacter sp.]